MVYKKNCLLKFCLSQKLKLCRSSYTDRFVRRFFSVSAGKTERDASVQNGKNVSLDENEERQHGLRVQFGGPPVRVGETAASEVRW